MDVARRRCCKNASAMLFVSAKISQFALLPQGRIEANERSEPWLQQWMTLVLGLFKHRLREAECPKQIKLTT